MTSTGGNIFVNREQAASARKALHSTQTLQGLSETFKVLGDVTTLADPSVIEKLKTQYAHTEG